MADKHFETPVELQSEQHPETVRLMDILILFTQRSRLFLGSTFLGALLLGGLGFLEKPVYTAEAVIMSPDSLSSASSNPFISGALNGSGIASNFGKSPADLFLAILKSRSVTDYVIQRFQLERRYKSPRIDIARKGLSKRTQFQADKSGLISIDYTDTDPEFAASVANGFVEALYKLQGRLTTLQAAQQQGFYRKQVEEEQDALQGTEREFLQTQQRTGIVTLTTQTESALRSIADQKANIARQEATLQSVRYHATEENPEVRQLEAGLQSSRNQLVALEAEQSQSSPEKLRYSTSQPPEAVLAYSRTLRDVQYHQAMLQALIKQLGTAKLDAERSVPQIQIVDKALPPPYKSGPTHSLYVIAGAVFGFAAAFVWVLWQAAIGKVRQDPAGAAKLRELHLSVLSSSHKA